MAEADGEDDDDKSESPIVAHWMDGFQNGEFLQQQNNIPWCRTHAHTHNRFANHVSEPVERASDRPEAGICQMMIFILGTPLK